MTIVATNRCTVSTWSSQMTEANWSVISVSVTNALCVGAIPQLPDSLVPSQQLAVDIYTTSVNGTITITGNNTVLLVQF